ncbi:MAG: hypothetical protein SPF69_07210 [Candidatus Ornithospirochaeta sp.]|nr:hypothetical protein [Sphaerochaetaceae bacterium]MDY5523858.1 hypothetical protein [Candidatus Ornithospirochaeta sp.]
MKKNFMAIASLLIAAMLLVVSCSQESVVPENNGLVEASLSVGYGRDIKVDGDTDAKNLTVEYKMTPQWTNTNGEKTGDDQITNPAKDWTTLPDSGNLGWITPGHWLIEVRASKGEVGNKKIAFSGSINAYFSNKTHTATVYLSPAAGTSSITIDVSMQDIKDDGASTNYKLTYEILTGKGERHTSETDIPEVTPTEEATEDYITEYKTQKISLDPGFYTVIVYVVDAEGTKVGGIRKGLLLADGDNANLTGHIEPADYSNVTINAVYVDVNVALSDAQSSYNNDKKKYILTVTATDSTTVPGYAGNNFTVTYEWFVNGDKVPVAQSNSLSATEENAKTGSKTFEFTNPGYKNIACQATYKVTVAPNTEYYFTETASTYVLVNPTVNQPTGSAT